LQAGIDVHTTVNVQHLDSLNDIVAQITGVLVRETVPDAILEQADKVELVDLPPEELLQRLQHGKVYVPQQAERATRNFFRKGNLMALRELALRRTADRVDADMQAYRQAHAIAPTWPAAERVLVCVSPSPAAARLVRAARRMAASLRAEWVAVYVETPRHATLGEADRLRVTQTLRLAEQLGAETATLSGADVSAEILAYARRRNVTKIVAGKPTHPRWRDIVFGSLLDELVRQSGDIDVYVISGLESVSDTEAPQRWPGFPQRTRNWPAYAASAGVVVACTLLATIMYPYLAEANLVMVYLLGVVIVASRFGRGPAVAASILSVAVFDFFFVPPFYTFVVAQTQYLITFGVMLTVALMISTLTVRLRLQAQHARERERRTAALYALSRDLASTSDVPGLLQAAAVQLHAVFETQAAILMPNGDGDGPLVVSAAAPAMPALDANELGVAAWCFEHGAMAGYGANTLPGADALYLPLSGSQRIVGVVGVWPFQGRTVWEPEQMHLLETFANQIAIGVERATLAAEAERGRVQVETERMRNTLLSSVSHDLRTPLASITLAASSLLEEGPAMTAAVREELLRAIYDEGERLNRLVSNLLDMTRLESGGMAAHKEWHLLEEVVGSALARLERQLEHHTVVTRLPYELTLAPMDGVLTEQVLVNLLENAAKFSPSGSTIEVETMMTDASVTISVADEGPGLAPGDELRVFEKFYRGAGSGVSRGIGLGLAICRAMVEAQGGRIWAERRPEGGARFSFSLPIEGEPPLIEREGKMQATPDGV